MWQLLELELAFLGTRPLAMGWKVDQKPRAFLDLLAFESRELILARDMWPRFLGVGVEVGGQLPRAS